MNDKVIIKENTGEKDMNNNINQKADLKEDLQEGARYVQTYETEEGDFTLVWFGGHMIHLYTPEGEEVDVWNVGDMSKNDATIEEVKASINEYISEMEGLVMANLTTNEDKTNNK